MQLFQVRETNGLAPPFVLCTLEARVANAPSGATEPEGAVLILAKLAMLGAENLEGIDEIRTRIERLPRCLGFRHPRMTVQLCLRGVDLWISLRALFLLFFGARP